MKKNTTSPVSYITQRNWKINRAAWIAACVMAFTVYHFLMSSGTKFEAIVILVAMLVSSVIVIWAPLSELQTEEEFQHWKDGKFAYATAGLACAIEAGTALFAVFGNNSLYKLYHPYGFALLFSIVLYFMVRQLAMPRMY